MCRSCPEQLRFKLEPEDINPQPDGERLLLRGLNKGAAGGCTLC